MNARTTIEYYALVMRLIYGDTEGTKSVRELSKADYQSRIGAINDAISKCVSTARTTAITEARRTAHEDAAKVAATATFETDEAEEIAAAKTMSSVGASGYFGSRSENNMRDAIVKAIRALSADLPPPGKGGAN